MRVYSGWGFADSAAAEKFVSLASARGEGVPIEYAGEWSGRIG